MRSLRAAFAALSIIIGTAAAARAQVPPVMPTNQAQSAIAVSPSDTVDLPNGITLGVFNGNATACNIAITAMKDGATATTWANVQSGAVLPVRAKRIWATNTTCSNLLALY